MSKELSEATEKVKNTAKSRVCHPEHSEGSEELSAFKDSSFHSE
ncbi:hypothetical protein SAMN02745975_02923 [Geosporobacter subterraneus DSM 17957]|uniref:Uncharacterized protein n=1 Tax=Geosporobacter subterraneus DSM 17957 TaxID=1121919 RepID=A0A1M6MBN4_9FIRM|nr:hypothetical protein SAMN02745975_02923 [Geosporobacter subterraneus DSM 17957]